MSTAFRVRTLLRFTIALSCWLQARHLVLAANVTVSDADPSIIYQPAGFWHASTDLCTSCLDPHLSISFHEGLHPPPGPDADDSHSSTLTSSSSTGTAAIVRTQDKPSPTSTDSKPNPSSSKPANSDPNSHKAGSSRARRRSVSKSIVQRLDPDDGGFVDPTVSMSFNFTGSAVFLFATQPPNTMNANETSWNMNTTVFVDGMASPTLTWKSASATYLPSQLVFSTSGLTEGQHQLVVQLGQNSTFIFEHLVYATEEANTTTSSQSSPSPTVDPKPNKHNIATFAGAVGGSVGVLGLFSLCLALSIIRRRQLAAKRERRDHESLHTNASDDSPAMVGPAPFVPRYFPDTVIPADPPTYMAAVRTNHNSSTLLSALPAEAFGGAQRSYADIPPATVPPPAEDSLLVFLPPPPPFELDTPPSPPALPLPTVTEEDEGDGGALSPAVAGTETEADGSASVRTEPEPERAPGPELAPLLPSTAPPSRPQSISAGSSRSDDGDPPTEATRLREDAPAS